MKYLFTLFGSLLFSSLLAQPTVTEWELNQYKQKGDRVRHNAIPNGLPLKMGNIYSWKASDGMYWDWTYGKLVDIDDNKYFLETYPQPGLKQIAKVQFKNLYTVDTTNMRQPTKPIDLRVNNYMDLAGNNLRVSALFLTATLANIVFYPQIVKFKSSDDIVIFNMINSGLILGTVISINSAGLNIKLSSKQVK